MKFITALDLFLAGIVTAMTISISQLAQAQLPLSVDDKQPPGNSQPDVQQDPTPTSATSGLKVSCQNLKTIVKKGDREAVMLTWSYGGFGKEYTPAKRCQIVSARLQKAANLNGGTFKDIQLASGTLNSQSVICALPANDRTCTSKNLLFTLKPENASNPEAIIQQIFSFAQDGNSSLNESASRKPQVNKNLGEWEKQVFAGGAKKSPATNPSTANTGF
jgi:hypothetical protein